MNPWLMEELVRARMEDQRRYAATHRLPARRPLAGWSRRVGQLLIRTGQRLTGPEPQGISMAHRAGGLGVG